jgi:hypothetical protein
MIKVNSEHMAFQQLCFKQIFLSATLFKTFLDTTIAEGLPGRINVQKNNWSQILCFKETRISITMLRKTK